MQMVCPECNRVESFDKLPMRLQKCAHCGLDGTDTYLTVPSLENRQTFTQAGWNGRMLLERRRLRQEHAAPLTN